MESKSDASSYLLKLSSADHYSIVLLIDSRIPISEFSTGAKTGFWSTLLTKLAEPE